MINVNGNWDIITKKELAHFALVNLEILTVYKIT